MTPGPGVDPGPHRWEVSALTTPLLAPLLKVRAQVTPPTRLTHPGSEL